MERFSRALAVWTILTLLAMSSECHAQASGVQQHAAGKKSNIVFILVDNLGYGELGVYGGAFFVALPLRASISSPARAPVS
jgi:hypothetical protein